jgi:hypothetical protein
MKSISIPSSHYTEWLLFANRYFNAFTETRHLMREAAWQYPNPGLTSLVDVTGGNMYTSQWYAPISNTLWTETESIIISNNINFEGLAQKEWERIKKGHREESPKKEDLSDLAKTYIGFRNKK